MGEAAKHNSIEGNTRRLLRDSEDDETPQRSLRGRLSTPTSCGNVCTSTSCASKAQREPAESVVYFRRGKTKNRIHPVTVYININKVYKKQPLFLLCYQAGFGIVITYIINRLQSKEVFNRKCCTAKCRRIRS